MATENPSPQPDRLIEGIFRELSLIYGHLWTSTHPTVEMWEAKKRKWAKALDGVAPEQIRKALNACHEHKHPPTLPEFLEMAKGPKNENRTHPNAYQFFRPALPKPVNKELAQTSMAEIMKKLGTRKANAG